MKKNTSVKNHIPETSSNFAGTAKYKRINYAEIRSSLPEKDKENKDGNTGNSYKPSMLFLSS